MLLSKGGIELHYKTVWGVALTKHRSVVTEATHVVTARITIPHALVYESASEQETPLS